MVFYLSPKRPKIPWKSVGLITLFAGMVYLAKTMDSNSQVSTTLANPYNVRLSALEDSVRVYDGMIRSLDSAIARTKFNQANNPSDDSYQSLLEAQIRDRGVAVDSYDSKKQQLKDLQSLLKE